LRYEDKFLKNQVLLSLIRQQIFSLELSAEALGTFSRKPKIFRSRVRKAIINRVKCKEEKCGENHLKVQ
jgi:hypothetical protein